MATYDFTSQLGDDLTLTAATAYAYGIAAEGAEPLGTQSVTDGTFTWTLDAEAYRYLYVVLRVDACEHDGSNLPMEGREVLLLTVFGAADAQVSLGLRETVAHTFCFARFTDVGGGGLPQIAAEDRDVAILCGLRNHFVAVDGTLSEVIQGSPNGMETNSYALFNSLANLLHACLVDRNTYASFTKGTGGTYPAMRHVVLHPWDRVQALFDLATEHPPTFTPALPDMTPPPHAEAWSPVPHQWTLTVKMHDSGAQNFLIAGAANIAWDAHDRAWLATNVTQGSPNSSSFCVVLEPDGTPADFSPVFGGGILGVGFGVVANADGSRIVFSDFGWGPKQYNPQVGAIAVFDSSGKALSPPGGYTAGLSRSQGMAFDAGGNLWMTSWGTQEPLAPSNETLFDFVGEDSAIVVYQHFDGHCAPKPEDVLTYRFAEHSRFHGTFDVDFDSKGHAFVSNAGSKKHGIPSSVYKLRLNTDDPHAPFIECLAQWPKTIPPGTGPDKKPQEDVYHAFRQVAVDANDAVFVAAVGAGCVMQFDNDLNDCVARYDHEVGRPWGVAFDHDGAMYAANFFALHEQPAADGERDVRGLFGVTVFRDADPAGGRIMTLPSGGAPVRLANGFKLYGEGYPDCYQPLSRLTSAIVDRVGNVWAINNWKPSAYIDFEVNPGGDGVVIFLGVAAPGR